ncbi:MAG: sigma-70 family RNA polymerase sigma factor [Holophagales bacterium]|nr:sigma-70 family RNA polymerase sigma factor [Holophagales bacterium]
MPHDPAISSESFEQRFRQTYDSVYYWFLRRGIDPETSRELAQDTFLAAYKSLESFRGESSFRTWVLRIARNIYRNYLRGRNTLKRGAPEVSLGSGSQEVDDEPAGLEDPKAVDPEEHLLEGETRKKLHGGLDSLPPQIRQCLLLRLDDLKYREIAAIQGISIDTVKSYLHQARQRLREHLRPASEEDRISP